MHNLSPFVNELIKHKPKEEQDDMHEIKIRVFHKAYKQVFKQLYTIIMLRFTKQE
jgi:transcriptional regulator CtsR